MGQSMNKLGSEEISSIIANFYDSHFAKNPHVKWKSADFYHAICELVEELNKKLGSTQFRVPDPHKLEQTYEKHHKGKEKSLTVNEFQQILRDVIHDTGVTGFGAKDLLFYIFGIPVTALFVKQRLIPKAIRNEFFIPGVTSATVLLLAKLNKI